MPTAPRSEKNASKVLERICASSVDRRRGSCARGRLPNATSAERRIAKIRSAPAPRAFLLPRASVSRALSPLSAAVRTRNASTAAPATAPQHSAARARPLPAICASSASRRPRRPRSRASATSAARAVRKFAPQKDSDASIFRTANALRAQPSPAARAIWNARAARSAGVARASCSAATDVWIPVKRATAAADVRRGARWKKASSARAIWSAPADSVSKTSACPVLPIANARATIVAMVSVGSSAATANWMPVKCAIRVLSAPRPPAPTNVC